MGAPGAPSTKFTAALRRPPPTARAWYSPGFTRPAAPHPGEEACRSHQTRTAAGVGLARTTGTDPGPAAQPEELQIRCPCEVITSATNLVPRLKRHGRRARDPAWITKLGVLPAWYQYWGDETRSVTAPGAHALAAARCGWPRWRLGDGLGEGAGAAVSRSWPVPGRLELCARRDPRAGPLAAPARSTAAVVGSIPLAAQLKMLSSPMATAATVTRRRQ
jgi:hypothetical protein